MKRSAWFAVGAVAVVLGLSSVACGGGDDPKTAKVTAGEMPEGETWTGVYYHPIYGYLHVQEEGSNVVGRWLRTDKSAWGEMSGTKSGNVVHFQWKEHKIGMVGVNATTIGKGVFVYKPGKEGIPEIDGQYGLADSEVGSDWHMVKQQRMAPELNSIPGNAGAEAPSGDGWN